MKGRCKDCIFLRKEYALAWDKNFTFSFVLDTWCTLCNIFKSDEGYCDCWESNE